MRASTWPSRLEDSLWASANFIPNCLCFFMSSPFPCSQVDDCDALPYYPYRDDAILLHQVIWDYVREVLENHYGKYLKIKV